MTNQQHNAHVWTSIIHESRLRKWDAERVWLRARGYAEHQLLKPSDVEHYVEVEQEREWAAAHPDEDEGENLNWHVLDWKVHLEDTQHDNHVRDWFTRPSEGPWCAIGRMVVDRCPQTAG